MQTQLDANEPPNETYFRRKSLKVNESVKRNKKRQAETF